ncbi:MAG TPA: hypothetical protein VEB21_07595 [Terriglobales bacterium]|nr:hypothetical protein [Terriglobales bacterium]
MKMTPLRGCAVLALLCLLPRATALPLTHAQTFTSSLHLSAPGGTLSLHDTHIYDLFDVPGGTLLSVQFDAQVTATLILAESNPYNDPTYEWYISPFYWNPSTDIKTRFLLIDDSPEALFHELTISTPLPAPTYTIEPNKSVGFAGTVAQHYVRTFTLPSDLEPFAGSNGGRLIFNTSADAFVMFGGAGLSTDTTITLTYSYSVPDDGAMAGGLLATLAAMLVAHRRIAPTLGREPPTE